MVAAALLLPFCFAGSQSSLAQGIYRNAIGARGMSMGGAEVGYAEGPLSAMAYNPAGLSSAGGPWVEGSLLGGIVTGDYDKQGGAGGSLKEKFRVGSEGAFAMPVGKIPLTIGLSVIPESALLGDWRYPDVPGAGGAQYGGGAAIQHKSEILVLRSALGLAYQISDTFSIGASVGLIYNDNTLTAPYIFQTQPGLVGGKVLLDLNTDGFGVDGTVGALWKASDTVQVGVSYKSPSTVNSKGDASGFLGGAAFQYDAEVVNHFPQVASLGASWQASRAWRLAAQVDWMNWRNSFDDLQVKLRNGSVGFPASLDDQVPLRWKDQWVFRGGAEYAFCENWAARGGYSFGKSPVPDAYLTPLVAAIMEHTLGVGLGWHKGPVSVDAAYQYSIPSSQSVGNSGLAGGGEYSNSKVEVSAHAFAVTAGYRF
jgi:long-chain fatty acid transport protein